MRPADLRGTVAWFQDRVVAPHERRRRRLAPADRHVRPSATLRPEQRMAIYADAYLARLLDALEDDFPALARLLGPQAFRRTCRAYLERHPSRSRSLNPLGRRLPDVLSGRAADVARVEAAISEVFDGEPAEPLTPADFGRMTPRSLSLARLGVVPAFRLLALDHEVNPFVDAVLQERGTPPPVRKKRSWVAVYRKDFKVHRLDLPESAHAALSALLRGSTVGAAVGAAARRW